MSVIGATDGPALGGIAGVMRPATAQGRWPLVLASLGTNVLALSLPIFILQIYDRVLGNAATMTLLVLVIGLTIALILDVALRALRASVSSWNGARFEHMLRIRVVERLLRAPIGLLRRHTPGSYLERINAIPAIRDFYASQLLLAAVDLPFSFIFLAMIYYLGGPLVLVPLILFVLFAVIAVVLGRALRDSSADRAEADRQRYTLILEMFRRLMMIKALGLNVAMVRRAERRQERSAFAIERVMQLGGATQAMNGLFSQLNMVALASFGAWRVLEGDMTMGALAACILLSGRVLQPLQAGMGLWSSYQSVSVARSGIDEIMNLPSETTGRTETPALNGVLELRNVTFGHEPDAPALIDGVSLTIKPGEVVGIDGGSGSGKSTLLLLMAGLLRPSGGSIHVAGHDIDRIDPDWYRSHLALLPHDGVVYAGTILDNLTNFQVGERAHEALYLSYLIGLDETVKKLPDGFDTRVGAADILPAGLRQRVSILRELIKQPKIILFDDADQALDGDMSRRLIELLKQLGKRCAVVLVSSRPQVMGLAQRRYRLSRGKLVTLSSVSGKAKVEEVSA